MKTKILLWIFIGLLATANAVEFKKLTEAEYNDMVDAQKASEKKIAETIKKCKEDFESKISGDRLRAILVISKYKQADLTPILIKALEDSAAPVRQAALVAFSERAVIPAAAIEPIFNLFADEDIHIQRIATSTLPYLFTRSYFTNKPKQPTFAVTSAHKTLIHNCFATGDTTILKNLLLNYTRLTAAISPDDLLAALHHKSPAVRALALPASAQLLSPNDFITKVVPLMNQETESTVIIEYLKRLIYFPRKKSIIVAKRWLNHKNKKIAATALETAILQGNQDLEKEIGTVLESDDIPNQIKVRILWGIRNTRYANDTTVNTLLKSDQALLQTEGIKLLVTLDKKRKGLPQLLSLTTSPHSSVRQEAVKQISFYYRTHVTKAQITTIAKSEYTDVKQAVIPLLPFLKKDDRDDFLLDYLVDGDDSLQALALQSIVQLHTDGWRDILIQSLKSDSSRVQGVAVQYIDFITPINQRLKYLSKYIKRKNNSPQLQQYAIRKMKLLLIKPKKSARSHK